jgi:hypothetical protein
MASLVFDAGSAVLDYLKLNDDNKLANLAIFLLDRCSIGIDLYTLNGLGFLA